MATEELIIYNRLIGAREAAAGFDAEAAAAARLAGSLDAASLGAEKLRRRSFLMNQALFTARRFAYMGTLAIGALGASALAMGIKFDAGMEQSRVAFTHFLGSAQAANKELDYLYNLAALTPFEFPQLTQATRRFLAFGFSLKETNRYMKIIGDTAAGLGAGADVIERLVLVFGQIRASGRVLGGDLRQLQQIGIDVYGAFRRQLGLTQEQIRELQKGNLFIPSNLGIEALMRDMNRMFKGSAREQSRTLLGMLSTLHDFVAQAMGAVAQPLVDRLEATVIPRLIRLSQRMSAAAKEGGGATAIVRAMNDDLSPRSNVIIMFWERLLQIARILRNIWRASLPGFRDAAKIIIVLAFVIGAVLLPVLEFLSRHLLLVRILVMYLVFRLVLLRTAFMLARTFAFLFAGGLWRIIAAEKFGIIWNIRYYWTVFLMRLGMLRATFAMFLFRLQMIRLMIQLKGLRATMIFLLGPIGAVITAIWGAVTATWAWTVALLANPVTWVVLAILVLIGTLVLLYIKWKAFHDFVNHNWKLLLLFMVAPFLAFPILVIKNFRLVVRAAEWLLDRIKGIAGKIGGFFRKIWEHVPGHNVVEWGLGHVPFMAGGGTATTAGSAVVGERGPELLHIPRGASVVPLQAQQFALPGGGGIHTIRVPVYLDGRQIAEVVAEKINDIEAHR